jgi:hypothetical protein
VAPALGTGAATTDTDDPTLRLISSRWCHFVREESPYGRR